MRLLLALLAALTLSACATTGGDPRDPWEGLNRKTYAFNDALDKAVLKPIAQGYQKVTPAFAQEGVNNFYSNLEDVGTALNNIAQGKLKEGASDAARFVVNSVIGVLGLWDVATPMGFEKHDEDFGQTLGWWGVPPGPYLVLPLLGPSTARDAPARAVDPSWYYYGRLDDTGRDRVHWSLFGLDKVRTRANLLKAEGILDEAALDKYTFLRDAWLQRRRNQVFDGNAPKEKDEQ
jgi:phospholipid-binding lipoprotein MlaA